MSDLDLQSLIDLIIKYQRKELSPLEEKRFLEWIEIPGNNKVLEDLTRTGGIINEIKADYLSNKKILAIVKSRIGGADFGVAPSPSNIRIQRFKKLNSRILKWAVAASVLVSGGIYLWSKNENKASNGTRNASISLASNILPGSNKATLTLSNGRLIVLGNEANGLITKEGNTQIKKTDDGQIRYDAPFEMNSGNILSNTIATPRGGKYEIILPDGSRVWINSSTTLVYPTRFSARERKVTLDGEAYFEVAKNKISPFVVAVGSTSVEVLGTHFNINSFREEGSIKTTLLEGSVKVKNRENSIVIVPGEQAIVLTEQNGGSNNNIEIKRNVNLEGAIAWKNGRFHFENASIREVMRSLSRWYNIEVEYQGEPTNHKFSGDIEKELTLSEVIEILGDQIHYILQGNKLIVLK